MKLKYVKWALCSNMYGTPKKIIIISSPVRDIHVNVHGGVHTMINYPFGVPNGVTTVAINNLHFVVPFKVQCSFLF